MKEKKNIFYLTRNIFLLCFLICFITISSDAQTTVPELQLDKNKTGLPFGARWNTTIIEGKGIQDNKITGKKQNLPFKLQSCLSSQKEDITEITTEGFFEGPDNTKLPLEAVITVNSKSPIVILKVKAHSFPKTDLKLSQLSIQIPISSLPDKRFVNLGGDRGIVFNSRYKYIFNLNTSKKLMKQPDHNEWTDFSLVQDAPNHFHMFKSESNETSALTMMHGEKCPGWIDVSDDKGGLSVALKNMPSCFPCGLTVKGAPIHAIILYLYPPTVSPLNLKFDSEFSTPAGKTFVFALNTHKGKFNLNKLQNVLSGVWPDYHLPEKSRKIAPSSFDIHRPSTTAEFRNYMISGGVCFPYGALKSPKHILLIKNGHAVRHQSKITGYWSDGSIKWLNLCFSNSNQPSLKTAPISSEGKIDLRLLSRLDPEGLAENNHFTLYYGKNISSDPIKTSLKVTEDDKQVIIDTGKIRIVLKSGVEGFIHQIEKNGKKLLQSPAYSFLEYTHTDEIPPPLTETIKGTIDFSKGIIKKLIIEEKGPIRAVIKIEGKYKNKPASDFFIRLEAYNQQSYIKITHTFFYMSKNNEKDFISQMGIGFPTTLNKDISEISGKGDGKIISLGNKYAGVTQPSYLNAVFWQAKNMNSEKKVTLYAEHAAGWLDMTGKGGGVALVHKFMWQEFPKEITTNGNSGEITAFFWPKAGKPMDMRRYSVRPHRSQGEAISTDWKSVRKWVPGCSFGIAKTHEMMVYFHERDVRKAEVDSLTEDYCDPPVLYASPKWYSDCHITAVLPIPDKKRFPIAENQIERLLDFYLFHQKYWGWYGMWNFGDIPHAYGLSYGWYSPTGNKNNITFSYQPENGWNYDNGRWGWTNTEGLPNLAFQLQFLRTGKRKLYKMAEAMARHNRDVDQIHYGPQFGKGIRHGVQNWSDFDREERVTIASAYRFYYHLSGDERCRDVLQRLVKEKHMKGRQKTHAQHSARYYNIMTMWELTGNPEYGKSLENYTKSLTCPQGLAIETEVEFPSGNQCGGKRGMNDGSMFWYSFGGMFAMYEYYLLTRGEYIEQAVIEAEKKVHWPIARTFAGKYGKNPEVCKKGLRAVRYKKGPPENQEHWLGPESWKKYFTTADCFFWINQVFYPMAELKEKK